MSTLSIFRCTLCQDWAITDAVEVVFACRTPSTIALDEVPPPRIRVSIKTGPPTCGKHRTDVGYRTAWNVYHQQVAGNLLAEGKQPPTDWATVFGDGVVIEGKFGDVPEGLQ